MRRSTIPVLVVALSWTSPTANYAQATENCSQWRRADDRQKETALNLYWTQINAIIAPYVRIDVACEKKWKVGREREKGSE